MILRLKQSVELFYKKHDYSETEEMGEMVQQIKEKIVKFQQTSKVYNNRE